MSSIAQKVPTASPWPWILVGMLVFQASLCMVGVVAALRDRSFAVETDYHRKAVDWDRIVARQRVSRQLGWHTEVQLKPAGQQSNELILTLRDETLKPISDSTVTLQYFHHARASKILEATLKPMGNGTYRLAAPLDREGLWEFRIVARTEAAVFTDKLLVTLTLPKAAEAAR